MKQRAPRGRPGFSLVELLIGMLVAGLILQALVGYFVGQSRMVGENESLRTAREAARSAMHVFMADLRRVEGSGGVEAAAADEVTVRVPYALGIVCSSTATNTTVSMLPVDSVLYTNAGISGYAWRNEDGDYSYVTSATVEAGTESACTDESIETLDDGNIVRLTPGAGSIDPGSAVMMYQRLRYEFRPGTTGSRLIRTVLSTDDEEVLVETFDSAATRFRFYNDGSTTPDDDPAADLSDIYGLQIVLEGLGDRPRPGGEPAASAELAPSVFFKN